MTDLNTRIKQLERSVEKLRAKNRHKQKVIDILRLRTEKGLTKWQIKDSRERINKLVKKMGCSDIKV